MTEETQQPSETLSANQQNDQNAVSTTAETGKVKEGKKEKCRPMTKVVIRRLPPTMTQEQFLEQVSPLPEYDYMYFAKADMSLGQYAFSRAYVDFVDPQDIFAFREKFDNYVFVDAKGLEFPAVVEYAPFQRVPKKRVGKKKDLKCGTIESDPYYIGFLESLKSQEADTTSTQPKTEYSFQLSDHARKTVTTTPLLDFLKQRKQEKQRLRDEKREEKRRRDIERKRSKDEPMVSKVLKNIDDRERDKDRDMNRENKENKDDKERTIQKDIKNRKKDDRYRDKMNRDREAKVSSKNFRDREDRLKDREIKQSKKHEDKKFYNKKDDRESHDKEETGYKERKLEEKRGKSYEKMRQEKRRLAESQKKQNVEPPPEEPEEDHDVNDAGDEDDEESHVKSSVEKNDEEKKPKHKNKKTIDSVKSDTGTNVSEQVNEKSEVTKTESDQVVDNIDPQDKTTDEKHEEVSESLEKSKKEDTKEQQNDHVDKKSPTKSRIKRRSSLESGGDNAASASGNSSSSTGNKSDNRDLDGASLRRHKSLDGGDENKLQKIEIDDKEKDKKDSRSERRTRNKRPALEIYRPGMGIFSKQRLEREKRSNEERSTPSQSPTPTTAEKSATNNYKSGKSSGSEVRSMTFKRSVGRDTMS